MHGSAATADQPVRCDLGTAGRADRLRQQRRLVVAALKQARPVQRHRDEQVGAGEDLTSGAVHPAPERPSHMGSVAVLQPEHEMAQRPICRRGGSGDGESRGSNF